MKKISVLLLLCFSSVGFAQTQKFSGKTTAVFIGTVIEIKHESLKEGSYDIVKFKVDTIIQYDTTTNINDRIFLNKKRRKAILYEEPSNNHFKSGVRYKVYVGCCNVDHYFSIIEKTISIE